jgi:O-antigen/teichoic acid export membrane protein
MSQWWRLHEIARRRKIHHEIKVRFLGGVLISIGCEESIDEHCTFSKGDWIVGGLNFKMLLDYCTVFVGSIFGRLISLGLSVLIAREFGSEGFGRFSLFFTLMMLAWQLVNVTDMVYVRFVKNDGQGTSVQYIRACLLMKAWAVLGLALVAYPSGAFISRYVFEKPETLSIILKSLAAGIFLSLFYGVSALYHAREDFRYYTLSNSIYYFLLPISIGLLWVGGGTFNLENVQLAYLIPAIILGITGVTILLKKVNYTLEGSGARLSRVMHFGKWLFAENIIYLVLQRIDLLFLTRYAGFEEVGIYSAAIRASMIVGMFTSSLSNILMPKGCESVRSGRARKFIMESLFAGAVISVAISIIILLCPYVIIMLFGEEYARSTDAARILMLEGIVTVVYTPFSYFLYAAGQAKQIFYIGLVKLFSAIIGLTLMASNFGAIGAAYSILASSVAGLLYTLFLSRKIFRNPVIKSTRADEDIH